MCISKPNASIFILFKKMLSKTDYDEIRIDIKVVNVCKNIGETLLKVCSKVLCTGFNWSKYLHHNNIILYIHNVFVNGLPNRPTNENHFSEIQTVIVQHIRSVILLRLLAKPSLW